MGGCETTPPDPRTPGNPHPQPPRLFLAPDPRPPLAGLKLVRPRPRPDGRDRCGRSSLTPDHATAPTRHPRGKPAIQSPPARRPQQVTGPISHAFLTKNSPMGGSSEVDPATMPAPRGQ